MWKYRIILIALISMMLGSCNVETAAQIAADEIDKAVTQIQNNLVGWQDIVKSLPDKLQSIESKAADDAKSIMLMSIDAAGSNIKCVMDFARDRAIQDLQRLANQLRGKPTQNPSPVVCDAQPASFSADAPPDTVEFYGYDLKFINPDGSEKNQVRAYLLAQGQPDLSLDPWTTFPSHYHAVINLGLASKIPFCNKTGRVIVLKAIASDGTNLGDKSEVGIRNTVCPIALPAPTPMPEITAYSGQYSTNHEFGTSENDDFGGNCDTGYRRSNVKVTKTSTDGHCEFLNWVGNDENLCKATVHFGAGGGPFGGQTIACHVEIFEVGKQLPAPTPQPCPCK